jgi:hypothetical protein
MRAFVRILILFFWAFVFLGEASAASRSTDIRVESSEKDLFSSTKKKEDDEESLEFYRDDSKRVGVHDADLRMSHFY